jgi:hypothetical protein
MSNEYKSHCWRHGASLVSCVAVGLLVFLGLRYGYPSYNPTPLKDVGSIFGNSTSETPQKHPKDVSNPQGTDQSKADLSRMEEIWQSVDGLLRKSGLGVIKSPSEFVEEKTSTVAPTASTTEPTTTTVAPAQSD